MQDDYHILLIALLVTNRLLLDEFYHVIELAFWLINDEMLLDDLILDFCYSSLSLETGELELTSTITLALQVNWQVCWPPQERTLPSTTIVC